MMGFIAIEQLQVQVAPRCIGKGLEKLAGQPKSERAGHVLFLFRPGHALKGKLIESTPDQVWPSAEIYNATRQTFVHGNVCFADKGVSRVKASAVTADAFLIPKRLGKGL